MLQKIRLSYRSRTINYRRSVQQFHQFFYGNTSDMAGFAAVMMARRYRGPCQPSYRPTIFDAVSQRNLSEVTSFLYSYSKLKLIDDEGQTVLHLAVKRRCKGPTEESKVIKICTLILRTKRVDINAKDRNEKTALLLAAKNGMMDVVNYLIGKGADLAAIDDQGNGLMHHVVDDEFKRYFDLCRQYPTPEELKPYYQKSVDIVKKLLSKKAKIDCANNNRDTPLHIATRRNLLHLIPILLEYTEDVTFRDKDKKNALHILIDNKFSGTFQAISNSCYEKSLISEILRMMLLKGFSINTIDRHGNTPMTSAFSQDKSDFFELMCKKLKETDVTDDEGNTIMHFVIDNCIDYSTNQHKIESSKFVRILLANSVAFDKPNSRGYKPVHLAAIRLHPTILKTLILHEANLKESYNGGNMLHLISKESSKMIEISLLEEVIRLLVSRGCDVNSYDKDGMTPIHLAVTSKRISVIKVLINYNANVNARELYNNQFTPLHMAVMNEHQISIKTLLKFGADIHAKDSEGMTALHLAVKSKIDVVKTLLDYKADIDEKDNEDLMPHHYAITEEKIDVLEELLEHGADINDLKSYQVLFPLKHSAITRPNIIEHWIKLKTAGLPAYSVYSKQASANSYQDFYQGCLKEVELLKSCKISTSMSLYDLLRMDWNSRCRFVGTKAFKELIGSEDLQKKFPKYYVLILACYNQTIIRKPLLEPAKQAWFELTKINLPDVCVFRILAHLRNIDLRVMSESLSESCDLIDFEQCNLK